MATAEHAGAPLRELLCLKFSVWKVSLRKARGKVFVYKLLCVNPSVGVKASVCKSCKSCSLHLHHDYTTLHCTALQLHYTALAPATCQSISGLALPSVIHNKQPLL